MCVAVVCGLKVAAGVGIAEQRALDAQQPVANMQPHSPRIHHHRPVPFVSQIPTHTTLIHHPNTRKQQVEEGAVEGKSFVELQFADNETHKLFTADLKLQDILKLIDQKTTEMEARLVFKEVGFELGGGSSGSSGGGGSKKS